jgi:hypothetical protein
MFVLLDRTESGSVELTEIGSKRCVSPVGPLKFDGYNGECGEWEWVVSTPSACTLAEEDGIYQSRRNSAYFIARNVRPLLPYRTSNNWLTLYNGNRKTVQSAPIDISRNAQLRDIEASFAAANDNFDLSSLKHPNKPDITAVESYPILPDVDIWPNQYDLFRFSERPGDRPVDVGGPVPNTHSQLATHESS